MDIKEILLRRGLVLCGIGREADGQIMLKAENAIELLERGNCPYCGMPQSTEEDEL